MNLTKKQTNEAGEFILNSGSTVQVPMMKLKAHLRSGILPDKSGFVIELPYKGNNNLTWMQTREIKVKKIKKSAKT